MGCGLLMGGWVSGGSGWVFGMQLGCVFCCCCFFFFVVVVLVFCCVISGVRRWWVGCGWGVDGCW